MLRHQCWAPACVRWAGRSPSRVKSLHLGRGWSMRSIPSARLCLSRQVKSRAEALRNLSDRTGVDDVRALVTTLIQTDRFGTSIATALRMHSETLRTERRQRAEEQAAKTTIKMVVPLAVFILPSIIFVTLGPAMIQLFRQLSQGR